MQIDGDIIISTTHHSRNNRLSFWDALIVQAAIEGHAGTLHSEDMPHGQLLDSVRVADPLL